MKRRGIALGLVVVIITLLFLSAFVVLKMMRGAGSQMEYADSHLRALTIAESAAQGLIARMMAKPWIDRWFKIEPDFHGTPVALSDGDYVYIIQDTPGIPYSADFFVRARFRRVRRVVFYRVRYQDMLFKGLTNPLQDFALSVEIPTGGSLGPSVLPDLTAQVNQLLAKKSRTQGLVAEKWDQLAALVDPVTILREIGAEVPEGEIPVRSLTEDSRQSAVWARPKIPASAGGQSNVKNYKKDALFQWIQNQGYESEFAAKLKSNATREFSKVDRFVDQALYLDGENTLKRILMKIYTDSSIVNLKLTRLKSQYQKDLRKLEAQAARENWTESDLAARKNSLTESYEAERNRIMRAGGF